jgi:hypothetical protein
MMEFFRKLSWLVHSHRHSTRHRDDIMLPGGAYRHMRRPGSH